MAQEVKVEDVIPSERPMSPRRSGMSSFNNKEHVYNLSTLLVTRKNVFHAGESNVEAFNRRTRELIQEYTEHGVWITCVRYFNFILYTGSQDSTIISWNIKTGHPIYVYNGHTGAVTNMRIAHRLHGGYERLFSSSWDGKVICWSLITGRHIQEYVIFPNAPVEQFEVHGCILYAGAGNVFKMVNTETGAVLKEFKDQPETLHHALAVDTYSRRVYTGGTRFSMLRLPTDDNAQMSHTVQDFRSDKEKNQDAQKAKVNHIVLGNSRVWTGHNDGSVREWDAKTLDLNKTFERKHKGPITSMVLHRETLCTGSSDCTIALWDRSTGEFKKFLTGHKDEIACVCTFRDMLYTSSLDGDVRTWDALDDFCYTGIYKGSAANIRSLFMVGHHLWSSNDVGFVNVWDCSEGKPLLEFKSDESAPATAVAVYADNVYVGSSKCVRRFSQEKLFRLKALDDELDFTVPPAEAEIKIDGRVTDIKVRPPYVFVASTHDIVRINIENDSVKSFGATADSRHSLHRLGIRIALTDDRVYSIGKNDKAILSWTHDGDFVEEQKLARKATAISTAKYDGRSLMFIGVGDEDKQDEVSHDIVGYEIAADASLKVVYTFKWHHNAIQAMLVADRYLFVASMDETVSIWNLDLTARAAAGASTEDDLDVPWHVLRHHFYSVWALAVSDGKLSGKPGELVLHSASKRLRSTEISTLSRFGIEVTYKLGCGRGGIFGDPVEPDEIEAERELRRKSKAVDAGGQPLELQVSSSLEEVKSDYRGDPDVDVAAPPADVRESDSAGAKYFKWLFGLIDLILLGWVVLLVDIIQLASFAFTIGLGVNVFDKDLLSPPETVWPNASGLIEAFQGFQTFTSSGTNSDAKFAGACVCVLLFWAVLIAQEGLEWRRFLFPSNRHVIRSWRLARFIVKVMTVPFFMPVIQSFVMAFACTKKNGEWVWNADDKIICYEDAHLIRVVLGACAIVFYLLPALRMVRVGTELENVEIEEFPLDWKQDHTTVEFVSPMSPSNTIPDIVALFVKTALVVGAIFLVDHPDTQAIFQVVVVAVLVAVAYMFPPYYSARMNSVRLAAYWMVFWFHLCAAIAQLADSDETAPLLCIATPIVMALGYFTAACFRRPPIPAYLRNDLFQVHHGRLTRVDAKRRSTVIRRPERRAAGGARGFLWRVKHRSRDGTATVASSSVPLVATSSAKDSTQ